MRAPDCPLKSRMHEILDHLAPHARVLDLGSETGSYPAAAYPFLTVCTDRNRQQPRGLFIQADAAHLPFRARCFDAVIANHSLEHFGELKPALQELGRVLRNDGALFVAVPWARTLTDRLYRRLYPGDHVNCFASAETLGETLAWYTGLRYCGSRTLYSSLPFLNRRNAKWHAPGWRGWPARAKLNESVLALLTRFLRGCDQRWGTRWSVYGWALYLGQVGERIDTQPWTNVCIRCGAGHESAWLLAAGRVSTGWLPSYWCPQCGARNYFTRDEAFPETGK